MPEIEAPKRRAGRPKGSVGNRSRPKTAKARLREYERSMPDVTLSDYTQLETLVSMEMEMEKLRQKLDEATEALERRKLSDAYTNYSKEYRLILQSLGIERSQRGSEIDMQKEVDALVEASTEVVEKSGRRITCAHCTSDYDMGILIFHFMDNVPWEMRFICPDCGKLNRLTGIMEMSVDGA